MADPANWYEWIKVAAFAFGLAFGGLAIGSPAWVWLRKQLLTATAGLLAVLGTVLISMSIWQSVEIEAAGLRVRIAELTDALKLQIATAGSSLSARSPSEWVEIWPHGNSVTYYGLAVRGGQGGEQGLSSDVFRGDPELREAFDEYLTKLEELSLSENRLRNRVEASGHLEDIIRGLRLEQGKGPPPADGN
jgi:hypothetical protein